MHSRPPALSPGMLVRTAGACLAIALLVPSLAAAQAAETPPPAPAQGTAQKPRPRRPAAAARTTTATVTVTDNTGQPLPGTDIVIRGPVERTGRTAANGTVHFAGLTPGDYRVQFDHDQFIRLERDVAVKGQPVSIDASLTPAPPAPPPPSPPPATARESHGALPQVSFDITEYLEKNYLTSGQNRVKQIACSPTDGVTLVQTNASYASAAEGGRQIVMVTIAGKGHVTVGGKTTSVDAASGTTVTVPGDEGFEASREGNRPLVFVLVTVGAACAPEAQESEKKP